MSTHTKTRPQTAGDHALSVETSPAAPAAAGAVTESHTRPARLAGLPGAPVLLKLGEVADTLRCTRRSLERQIAAGQIAVIHIGRSVRIEQAELDAYLARRRAAEQGAAGPGARRTTRGEEETHGAAT